MSEFVSLYPVSQAIAKVIRNSGYTPFGFLLASGYPDAETILPRLESWLVNGQGDKAILDIVAAYDRDEEAALYNALEQTAAMKAAGVDPVAYEEARKEEQARARFRPFVHAQGDRKVPSQITIFALTGGFNRWNNIRIPEDILQLPVEDQLEKVPELMNEYVRKYGGKCPFFGNVVGLKFVRYDDYFQFDAAGRLQGRVEERFQHGTAWVELH